MSRSTRKGFTVTELLVVIAIVAILVAFMMPATRRVREAAARTQCANNLKQLILAMYSFESNGKPAPYPSTGYADWQTERLFPPGCSGAGKTPEERLSWMVMLLPYLGQDPLYRQIDIEKGYAGNLPAAQLRIGLFICPESKEEAARDAVTHYVGLQATASWDTAARRRRS